MQRFAKYYLWLMAFSWFSWLLGGALFLFGPDIESLPILIVLLLVILILAIVGAVGIAITYQYFLTSWSGIAALLCAIALANLGVNQSTQANASFWLNVFNYTRLSLMFAYLTAVSIFIYKRDISVALFSVLLLLMDWATVTSMVHYRGMPNLMIAYLKEQPNGGFWWWDTLTMAFYCALPPMVVGFWAHLLRLGWKEWKRS